MKLEDASYYGSPAAIVGDSSVFCLACARNRYGAEQINYLVDHDRVYSLPDRDGEPLTVAREGMHDQFLCGLSCECGVSVCPYAEYGCECVLGDE